MLMLFHETFASIPDIEHDQDFSCLAGSAAHENYVAMRNLLAQ
jgi:hypothetical protein